MLTVDLDKSDLPLQTAFPIMMTNLLNWFGGTKGELREALPAGAVAEVELPAENPAIIERVLRRPGRPRAVLERPGRRDQGHVGPLDHTGVWSVVRRPVRDPEKKDVRTKDDGRPAKWSRSWPATWPIAARATFGPSDGLRRPPYQPGERTGRPGGPADLVLLAGLGLAALVLGVVPLSAEVDRLMGTTLIAIPDPARADPGVVAAGPGRAAGLGLLLLSQPGRFRSMAADACRSGCERRLWSSCSWPWPV